MKVYKGYLKMFLEYGYGHGYGYGYGYGDAYLDGIGYGYGDVHRFGIGYGGGAGCGHGKLTDNGLEVIV